MNNAEVLIAIARYAMDGKIRNPRQGRRFGGQVLHKILNGFCWPLDFDGYSGGSIADRACKAPAGRETIDVGPESNSLHNT